MTDPDDKTSSPLTLEKTLTTGSGRQKKDKTSPSDNSASVGKYAGSSRFSKFLSWRLFTILIFLLVIAVAFATWPGWGPTVPEGLKKVMIPILGPLEKEKTAAKLLRLYEKLERLDNDILGLRSDIAKRATVGLSKVVALEDAIKQKEIGLTELKAEVAALTRDMVNVGRADTVSALAERLSNVERRLSKLENQPVDGPEPISTVTADAVKSELHKRVTMLEKENTALRELVLALNERLGVIENKSDDFVGASRSNALVLAVGQLREAVRGTRSFKKALQAVESLSGDEPLFVKYITMLKPYSTKGVSDLTLLRVTFNRIAGQIAHETFVPRGDGWIDKTLSEISRIVTFRRKGPDAASRDDNNGRVARAELMLAGGNLSGAVAALSGLKGRAIAYAQLWLNDAQARLVVDAGVKALFLEALARSRASTNSHATSGG